jgi:hypothetical protein
MPNELGDYQEPKMGTVFVPILVDPRPSDGIIRFSIFHSKNPFHPVLSAKVRGSFPYEVSLLCEASLLPYFLSVA